MIYFIDITGMLLYLVFRIVILPVLLVVGCFFMLLFTIKTTRSLVRMIRSLNLKPAMPLFRFAKLRMLSLGKH